MATDDILEPVEGVRLWIDQEAIHLKAAESSGDPVELTEREARAIIDALHTLIGRIQDLERQ